MEGSKEYPPVGFFDPICAWSGLRDEGKCLPGLAASAKALMAVLGRQNGRLLRAQKKFNDASGSLQDPDNNGGLLQSKPNGAP
ncbi:hypothetical protein [Bradyrhizobium guangxiense]|uniref:hypothetical protein n=1 Tax=Bradyrhizobium guangxiense TaxID=1325115 RepID=UPI0010088D5D|nr:hypothetical protein [Bradyrhizobium guangxiense]